jgi:hypothetical protein
MLLLRALFTWTASPVEQACLAYLPAAKLRWQVIATVQTVAALGLSVATVAAAVMGGILALGPGLLVKDVLVQPLLASVAPQVSWL